MLEPFRLKKLGAGTSDFVYASICYVQLAKNLIIILSYHVVHSFSSV